jgi:DNA-directed RNA polymerase specialized sigma24 family protein
MTKIKKKPVQYFTAATEAAIVEYNKSESFKDKSKIYYERIHPAFFKLTENIIHTFKFYYTEVDNIEDLQHEVITFLLTKLHLFDPSKGAKAYSYFGTIAKRYLINSNNKNYKKRVEKAPVSEIESNENFSYRIDEGSESDKLIHFIDQYVEYCTDNINELFPKKTDAQIADAILELFRKRENIDVFNKKALYIYIREIIDAKTPKITKIADRLYDIFKQHYYYYLENGHTNF